MKRVARGAVVLAVVAILLAGVGRAEAETIDIYAFSGTFDDVEVLDAGSRFQLLNGNITVTEPDSLVAPNHLTISDVTVDLSGYGDLNGGNVTVVDDCLIINNSANGTSAELAVDSATLTQVLNSPIGIGYMSLCLEVSSSNLETDDDPKKTINLDVADAVITINGLRITTNGSSGTASLGTHPSASASISALVPEPSTLVLALFAVVGCSGFCWRRRARLFFSAAVQE